MHRNVVPTTVNILDKICSIDPAMVDLKDTLIYDESETLSD
jgi:hypothetical protein